MMNMKNDSGADTRPEYAAPSISSLRESEVLEAVGPAQAYTGTLPFGF